jgi:thioredoxin-related protein
MLRLLAVSLVLGLVPVPPTARAADAPKGKPADIYNSNADPKADIAAATARARKENKRVLVMYGGNWCGWCHKLHTLFRQDRDIARVLNYEYELVMVDTAAKGVKDVLAAYHAELKGVPFLTVLDADGNVLCNQETGAFEEGDHHDPAKVKAFLEKWSAEPVDAGKALEAALARAKAEDKRVFLHFGAPWCGWCHKLDDFLARKDIAPLIGRDFIDLKVDLDRMKGARDVFQHYNPNQGGGIPWFVFLDADGHALANSNDARGNNIGYPAAPHEIDHFMGMLKRTARRITGEQLDAIREALRAAAPPTQPEPIRARTGAR